MNVLIAGCGYVGTALGWELLEAGHRVWGLRRDPSRLPAAFGRLAADLADARALEQLPRTIDHVVYCAAADESSDPAYYRAYVLGLGNLLRALAALTLRRVFFTSSTAVYAQADGEWVDETSETSPTHFSGVRLLEAENLLRAQSVPWTVLRCSGIYGPGRTRLIESVRQGTARGSERLTNRIHRDDIAGAIVHLLQLEPSQCPELLLLNDDAPAPEREVLEFLAERLGVPAPPPPSPSTIPVARAGSKRCCNARLEATGYRLRYPTYREGYASMLPRAP